MAYWSYKIYCLNTVRMLFFLVLQFLLAYTCTCTCTNAKISQNMTVDNTTHVNATMSTGRNTHTIYFGKDGLRISRSPLNNRKNSQSPFMALFSLPIVQFVAYLLVLWAILEYPVFGLALITCALFYLCSYL
jgi:hypothetical protein